MPAYSRFPVGIAVATLGVVVVLAASGSHSAWPQTGTTTSSQNSVSTCRCTGTPSSGLCKALCDLQKVENSKGNTDQTQSILDSDVGVKDQGSDQTIWQNQLKEQLQGSSSTEQIR